MGLTHVRTSPHYPQSNGKKERRYGSLKRECLRPARPATVDETRRRMTSYVAHSNKLRLHAAIGYIAHFDKLWGREERMFSERDHKIEGARRLAATEQNAPRRTRTYNPLIKSQKSRFSNNNNGNDLRQSSLTPVAPAVAPISREKVSLEIVIQNWERLPMIVRAAIVAIVQATDPHI